MDALSRVTAQVNDSQKQQNLHFSEENLQKSEDFLQKSEDAHGAACIKVGLVLAQISLFNSLVV